MSEVLTTSKSPISSPMSQATSEAASPVRRLSWRGYRRKVLSSHSIRILDGAVTNPLPKALINYVHDRINDSSNHRYCDMTLDSITNRRTSETDLVVAPTALPWNDDDALLSRLTTPQFNSEALPQRGIDADGTLFELLAPMATMAYGFASSSFSREELNVLPDVLRMRKTSVPSETAEAQKACSNCPFLVFDRTRGQGKRRLEFSENRLATTGAWCLRALQKLYSNARYVTSPGLPDSPLVFTCLVDGTNATIYQHWISLGNSYCMSPVYQFDLRNEDNLDLFLTWVDSIKRWAIESVLPCIKAALKMLLENQSKQTKALAIVTKSLEPKSSSPTKGLAISTIFDAATDIEVSPNNEQDGLYTKWPVLEDIPCTPFSYRALNALDFMTIQTEPSPITSNHSEISPISEASNASTLQEESESANNQTETPALVTQNHVKFVDVKLLENQLKELKSELEATKKSAQNEITQLKTKLSTVLTKERMVSRSRTLPTSLRLSNPCREFTLDWVEQSKKPLTSPTFPHTLPLHKQSLIRRASSLQSVTSSIEADNPTAEHDKSETSSQIVLLTDNEEKEELEEDLALETPRMPAIEPGKWLAIVLTVYLCTTITPAALLKLLCSAAIANFFIYSGFNSM